MADKKCIEDILNIVPGENPGDELLKVRSNDMCSEDSEYAIYREGINPDAAQDEFLVPYIVTVYLELVVNPLVGDFDNREDPKSIVEMEMLAEALQSKTQYCFDFRVDDKGWYLITKADVRTEADAKKLLWAVQLYHDVVNSPVYLSLIDELWSVQRSEVLSLVSRISKNQAC